MDPKHIVDFDLIVKFVYYLEMIKTFNLHLGNQWDLPTVDKETLQSYHKELISVVCHRAEILPGQQVKSPSR